MRILRPADRQGTPAGVPAGDPVRGLQAAPGTPLNGPPAAPPARPRRVWLLVAVAVFVIAADIVSKAIVVARMPGRAPIRLLGGLLTITLTPNGGAPFSISAPPPVV